MKFVADENVDKLIVERIRELRYEVCYITEIYPSITDEEVLNITNEQNAILLTCDKDFGELIYRKGKQQLE